jgi:TPP-dependent 2-oxoacid decarboxylase
VFLQNSRGLNINKIKREELIYKKIRAWDFLELTELFLFKKGLETK